MKVVNYLLNTQLIYASCYNNYIISQNFVKLISDEQISKKDVRKYVQVYKYAPLTAYHHRQRWEHFFYGGPH